MHFSLQLDPTASFDLREGRNGTYEILITDENSEASTVIELSAEQLMALRDLR